MNPGLQGLSLLRVEGFHSRSSRLGVAGPRASGSPKTFHLLSPASRGLPLSLSQAPKPLYSIAHST